MYLGRCLQKTQVEYLGDGELCDVMRVGVEVEEVV